jgi:DNA-binding Lrp family transcriptional regulator
LLSYIVGDTVLITGDTAEVEMQRRLEQVDKTTGEILEGFVAYVAPRKINGFSKGWFAMGQGEGAARTFASRPVRDELGKEGFAVLMGVLARLDYENLLVLNQSELARELEMQPSNVNRSIKKLIDLGALIEGPKIGVSRSYRLSPAFGWKGTARGHVKALDDMRRERMKAAGISGVVQGGQQAAPERDTRTGDLFEGV